MRVCGENRCLGSELGWRGYWRINGENAEILEVGFSVKTADEVGGWCVTCAG